MRNFEDKGIMQTKYGTIQGHKVDDYRMSTRYA